MPLCLTNHGGTSLRRATIRLHRHSSTGALRLPTYPVDVAACDKWPGPVYVTDGIRYPKHIRVPADTIHRCRATWQA
jgi:hypothetical protein